MNYTNQILNNVGVYDVVSSKEEKIHEKLFNKALSEFKEQNKEYSDSEYLFIEHRTSLDYLQPSEVVIIQKKFPYAKTTEPLNKYWGDYVFNKKYDRIDNEDESLEIIEMIYTSNEALVRNKYTGEEFKLDFKQCNNIPYSEDWYKFKGDLNSKSSVIGGV